MHERVAVLIAGDEQFDPRQHEVPEFRGRADFDKAVQSVLKCARKLRGFAWWRIMEGSFDGDTDVIIPLVPALAQSGMPDETFNAQLSTPDGWVGSHDGRMNFHFMSPERAAAAAGCYWKDGNLTGYQTGPGVDDRTRYANSWIEHMRNRIR
jgi:hypothetical protein